jgi:tetratricopeptide (TPR) repeat protein
MLGRRWVFLLIGFLSCLNSGFGNPTDWKDSLQSGLNEHYLGHFAEAEMFLRAAIEGARLHGNESEAAGALSRLGDLYLSEDRYADAEDIYSEALSLYRKSEKKTGTADIGTVITLRSRGTTYALKGEAKKALSVLNDALLQAKKHFSSDVHLQAIILNSLGLAYIQDGDLKKAEPLFLQVLQIQPGENVSDFLRANALNNLAQMHREQRKYEAAEKEYLNCIEISEQLLGPSHPELAITRGSLAVMYLRMGRFPEAEDQALASLRIIEATKPFMPGRIVRALHILSDIYEGQGKRTEAEDTLARAAAIARKNLERDAETAVILDAYSAILKRSGKTDLARTTHLEADRVRTSMALTTTLRGLR